MHDFRDPQDWRQRRRDLQAYLRQHHGVITTAELHGLGFSDSAITRAIADDLIVRLVKGVYRSGSAELDEFGWMRAQVARSRRAVAIDGRSAAFALGHLQYPPRQIQLVIPGTSGYRRVPDRHRRSTRHLSDADFLTVRGLPCVDPVRMVMRLAADCASKTADAGDFRVLRRVLRGAANAHDWLVPALRTRIDTETFRGRAVLAQELSGGHLDRTRVVKSSVEDRFVELCRRYGLPIPRTNAVVHDNELDAFWEEHDAFVEIDVYATHRDEVAFQRDRAKIRALRRLGLRGFAVTDHDIDFAPRQVAEDVHGLLYRPGSI